MRIKGVSLLVLAVCLAACLWGLFFGQGSFARVGALEAEKASLIEQVARLERVNAELANEIRFLESGSEAILERARRDLNMIAEDEVLFKIN